MKAGAFDRRIRIERPVADDASDGAGSGTWELVADVPASVVDALPSRGERLADGINIATRPARVRMRYRSGISSAMRVLVGRLIANEEGGDPIWQTDRIMQIVTPPAELGRREGLEFMAEDYQPAGNPA
ncbi:MAG TPA: head-tail adaptor protein [Sphingobium sp.]|uniref:head-tail adaptor protein n=1 Tax=Sphingobium sp. TaxID=1912891 RepID=UPI002ED2A42C